MSYDLFVNCSIWTFSSKHRNDFINLLEKEGYKQGTDFEVTQGLDAHLINFKTVNEIIQLANYFKDKNWRKNE